VSARFARPCRVARMPAAVALSAVKSQSQAPASVTLRVPARIIAVGVAALALHACGGGGGGSSGPAVTASLTASITNVRTNGSVTLTWMSMNATSCT
jgi:hypothetical protein